MTNIDFAKLKTQYAIDYDKLSYDAIMNLYVYHPWNDGKNPKMDKITNTLLNLKKDQDAAVNYFSKVVKTQLLNLIDPKEDLAFCIIPSHTANDVSNGLMRVINNIKDDFGFKNTNNVLNRTKTVAKSSTGGDRSVQHHLDSIEVSDPAMIKNKTIFLFDDVSSTGNSMDACKKLLLDKGVKKDKGANKVVMISLGQTASYL